MAVLAFLVSVVYVPGYTGVSIATGWAMMSVALPIATWRPIPATPFHIAGALFFAFAILSLRWAPDKDFGIFHLWQLACIGGAFVLGSQLKDTRPVVIGLALGVGVSSVICIVQTLGYDPVLRSYERRASGLLFNSVACGEFATFVLIWLLAKRMWWYVPLVLPAFLLPWSRGAFAAAVLFACLRAGWFGIVLALAVIGLFILDPQVVSNSVRIRLWWEALGYLSWFGNGVGAVESVFLSVGGRLYSPEYLHNEYLEFIFHYGLVAIVPIGIMLGLGLNRLREEWYPYVCFLFLALFSFPLHIAPMAFAVGICAGYLSRDWAVVWDQCLDRGSRFLHRYGPGRQLSNSPSREALPLQ